MESFVAATDLHGDRQDKTAVQVFRKFVGETKPKLRVFLGDLWDFRALRTKATDEERQHSMEADFQAGMEFLDWYRPQVLLLGNHDQRLWDTVEKDGLKKTGPLVDLANRLISDFATVAKAMKITTLPYSKKAGVWHHEGLRFVHGFDGVNPEKMASIYGHVLYGHGHAIRQASAPGMEGRTARMIGCLCRLNMVYNRGQVRTLDQEHGWAYGVFLPRKRFEVFQARVQDKTCIFASGITKVEA